MRLGSGGIGERYLMVVQRVPEHVLANALAVQTASSEYQQRALERDGLRRMYLGTLTLVLILAVFAALLLAVTLGNQLARPLLLLADGVRQVAQGDLSCQAGARLARRAGRPDPLLCRHDRPAGRRARHGRAQRGRAGERAHPPADHPRQPDRRRDRVRCAGPHRHRQPRRHAHPAPAAVGLPRPQPWRMCRNCRRLPQAHRSALRAAQLPQPDWASATIGRTPSSCNSTPGRMC